MFVLKGLKQDTSNGCDACDACDDNVIMCNPNSLVCSIAYKWTWLPCPFRINKCWLLRDTPLGTNLLKKTKKI